MILWAVLNFDEPYIYYKLNAYVPINIQYVGIYSITCLYQPTMGPTISGLFNEVVGLRSYNICTCTRFDRNKSIDVRGQLICGGGRL